MNRAVHMIRNADAWAIDGGPLLSTIMIDDDAGVFHFGWDEEHLYYEAEIDWDDLRDAKIEGHRIITTYHEIEVYKLTPFVS